uniref:Ig-like domain-containing protein n=1 Tax=Cyprinodon variegatus TaxID=28743 RepID=A0A3Q2D871_CYPVA
MFNNSVCSLISDLSCVVLQKPPSGPVQPELPEALQCSVLPNSERSTCPADNRVYWFRAGSDEPHPSLLYLQGNSLDECEKSSEAPSIQKCFYNFSETVDPGTYYCAVAACGQIIFGNGEKLNELPLTVEKLSNCFCFTTNLYNAFLFICFYLSSVLLFSSCKALTIVLVTNCFLNFT